MWQDFKSWYATPFTQDMSASGWFLFLGLLIVLAILWNMILRTIRDVT